MTSRAMSSFRSEQREFTKYFTLVKTMERTTSEKLQTLCVTFVNNLVNSSPNIKERNSIRRELFRLEFTGIAKLIAEEGYTPFVTQFEVFEQLMLADQYEMVEAQMVCKKIIDVLMHHVM